MSGLYLVDAMALAYRSFFALMRTSMRAPDGRPTTAVYGFAHALLRVVESRGPSHMAIVRDLPGPTFRHEMYPLYKAQRQPMPDDLKAQIPMVQDLAEACGLPLLSLAGHEADDLMATYAVQGKEQGLPVYLMTRDKDLMQLVCDGIWLFDPGRGGERPEEIDEAWVRAKFGVAPSQIRDYLTLVGDASDNIPGVPKVGEKTAVDLLTRYPDIEAIYANLEEIGATKKAVRKNLEEGRASMELSRELVTLRARIEGLPSIANLEFKGLDFPRMHAFLSDLGMRNLALQVEKLSGGTTKAAPDVAGLALFDASETTESVPVAPPANLQTVSDAEDLRFLAKILAAVGTVAIQPVQDETGAAIGIGLSWAAGIGRYLPLDGRAENISPETVETELSGLFRDPKRRWIGHDAKALRRSLASRGWEPAGRIDDVQLAAYMLAPGERNLSVERLSHARLGKRLGTWDELLGSGRSKRTASTVTVDEACGWAAGAAEAMSALWPILEADMRGKEVWEVYDTLEIPLSQALRRMEDLGIALDRELFSRLELEMTGQIAALEAKAQEVAGREFNLASPRQLGEVLFDHLGLKSGKKTESGQRSTDSDTLEALRGQHPLPGIALEYRELAKLLGTYVQPLPTLVDSENRVHTRFQQTIAATGRLSSIDPNLQNIPIRGEMGRKLRTGFVARPGSVLVSADYSQIELRLLAHLSQDEVLLAVYRAGEDIHARTAARVAGVAPESVTADQRRAAKVVNFGVVYGMGPHALAQQTGLSHAEAKKFIEGYFAAYPGVKPYMDSVLEDARRTGFVKTILGRKRWIREINDKNRAFRERAEREAVNTPIQGSAADLIKLAMLRVDEAIGSGKLAARMLLQVHDELVLECAPERSDEVRAMVRELMEGAMDLSVPLSVETGAGANWGGAH